MVAQRLKIAFVDYVLEPDKPGRSGLSDIVWDMASELTNQGHEVHVVASYQAAQYPDERVIVHNFEAPPMGYRNVIGNAWLLYRAARIVKRIHPDVVHAPEYLSMALLHTYRVKQPLIVTVPGNIYHRIKEANPVEWYYAQILKWAAKTSAKHCASIIAISNEMKYWWEKTGSAPERTPWIPLGVDTDRFFHAPDARVRLGISKDKVFLLFVGRFSKEKGLIDLLDVLSGLKTQLDPTKIQVTLIGEGPLEHELRERIEHEGLEAIVALRPWVAQDELSEWYSAADALLLPSHNEPLGRVMMEAMMCATPVIATATEGPKDHVLQGKTGLLFPARNKTALAEILESVIDNPDILAQMRPTTLAYAKGHLTWQIIVGRVVNEVYLPVSSNSSGARVPTVDAV